MYKILFSSDKNIVNKTIILFAIYQTIPIFAARITKKGDENIYSKYILVVASLTT